MLQPLVSVIIPTHNRWPRLGAAIESVLAQTDPRFELIVVDDGSSDGTGDRLQPYDGRLRYCFQPQGGVAAARNRGVTMASGQYLAFLDSDDLWLPQKLAVQNQFMAERLDAQISQTDEIWIRHGVRVNPGIRHAKPSGDIFFRSLELCLVSPSAVMMTRELFDAVGGFDESFTVCEDYDLWLRIALHCPVHLIPQALVMKYGGHDDQLSRSIWGMDRFRIRALNKLLQADLTVSQRQSVTAMIQKKSRILAQGARKRGREDEARSYEAAARNPMA